MGKVSYIILCTLLLCVVGSYAQAPITAFSAVFFGEELDALNNRAVIRSFAGTFYYQNDWNPTTRTGHEAMRFDIVLNDGTTQQTLTEIYLFEDKFFKYTICGGKCAWQDIYAVEPLPKLYFTNQDSTTGGETINGVSTNKYVFNQNNIVGFAYSQFVTLWVRQQSPNFPVRAEIKYGNIIKKLDFTAQSTNVPATVFNIPAGCPDIDSGCFRIDIAIVQDISGSVGNPAVGAALNFLYNLTNAFIIDAQHVALSHTTFSYCASIQVWQKMTYSKQTFQASLTYLRGVLRSDGWTCIVGGIMHGLWSTNTSEGGRPATKKGVIVITDGNGNRPCSTGIVAAFPYEECQHWDTSKFGGRCCFSCPGYSPCNGDICCQTVHDWQLGIMYGQFYPIYNPTIYAVGIGQDISDATLRLIVNNATALLSGKPRIFRVDDWFSLNQILTALATSVICQVPGSLTCPNDCRPGGFCCAGGCLCSTDCSLGSTECQASTCIANLNGAQCVLGTPDNSSCQDPRIQCQNRYCLQDTGCVGTADDSRNCTDNNLCTLDVCTNGTCISTADPRVSVCDDNNKCTINDRCDPNGGGGCIGTPTDTATCDDGDECTTDSCVNGVCQSAPGVSCTDPNTDDCLIPTCDPKDGSCVLTPVDEGFQCKPPPPDDNCTVYVCLGFSASDYLTCVQNNPSDTSICNPGYCRAATRDQDGCGSSDINTAGIIGGVVGGVALLVILGIAGAILLLFLFRKHVPILKGLFNPFSADMQVQDAATYQPNQAGGTSGLYS